jgi:hypothetical protein
VLQFAGADFGNANMHETELARSTEHFTRMNGRQEGTYIPYWAQVPGIRYTKPAQQAGLAQESFAIPVSQSGTRASDWIVHLPQRPQN